MSVTSLVPDVGVLSDQAFLSDALTAWQSEARERVTTMAFPSRKDEAWRYVPHRQLPALSAFQASAPKETLGSDLDVYCLEFVDGVCVSQPNIPGLTITNMQDASKDVVSVFVAAIKEDDAWIRLNQGYLTHGVLITVDSQCELDKPLMILERVTQQASNQWLQGRFVVQVGENAKLDVIHHQVSDDVSFALNGVTHITLSKHAHCSYLRAQDVSDKATCLYQTDVFQDTSSDMRVGQFLFGGAIARDALHVGLQGEHARVDLSGVYFPKHAQYMNIYTHMTHAVPNTYANQMYRGILCDHGQGVFYGRVHVLKDAQKTQAYQRNANLILGDGARVNTKPELEIYADDVICSHGATVGQLDEDQLFYLRSRGIPEKQAHALLLDGFSRSSTDCWKDSPAYDLLLAGVAAASHTEE